MACESGSTHDQAACCTLICCWLIPGFAAGFCGTILVNRINGSVFFAPIKVNKPLVDLYIKNFEEHIGHSSIYSNMPWRCVIGFRYGLENDRALKRVFGRRDFSRKLTQTSHSWVASGREPAGCFRSVQCLLLMLSSWVTDTAASQSGSGVSGLVQSAVIPYWSVGFAWFFATLVGRHPRSHPQHLLGNPLSPISIYPKDPRAGA